MNIAPFRKSILKESMVFMLLLGFFGGATYYLDLLNEDYAKEKDKVMAEANQLVSEKQNLETRFMQVKNGSGDYEEAQRWLKDPGLFIDSQALRELFNVYQTQFLLKKISVEMQPIMPMKDDPKYVRKNFIVTKSAVKVTIETLSDEDIYRFIQAMQKELPGFSKITDFSITRKSDISKQVTEEIYRTGTSSVISAEISFDWYGLQSTDPESPFNKYVPRKRNREVP